jgi:D-glycero-alpha-D-manno-heptose-7-phosphate kinase
MIITQTPLRISFLGGGTDYPEYFERHGGAVLGTAVDKSCYFSMSRFYSQMFDYAVRLSYRKVECVADVSEVEHVPFRECMRWAGVTKDVEIQHAAELPAMTGLGSSSSFVVGLLNTIYAFQRRALPPLELAYEAIELERKVLGESVGVQDQTFAAVGGFNLIEFRRMGQFVVHRLPIGPARLGELEGNLLCFFTGIRRRAEDLAKAQVKRVGRNIERLGRMRKMVDEGYAIITGDGSLTAFGELLDRSWNMKRELDGGITNATIDQYYETGKAAGAIGGKLLGAGGGGFLLFFAPPERHEALRHAFRDLVEVRFQLDAPGSHVLHSKLSSQFASDMPERKAA